MVLHLWQYRNSMECEANLAIISNTCTRPNKLVYTSTQLQYLGIVTDSEKNGVNISKEQIADILKQLNGWDNKKSCKKRDSCK